MPYFILFDQPNSYIYRFFFYFLFLLKKTNHEKNLYIFIILPTNCKDMFWERSAKLKIK